MHYHIYCNQKAIHLNHLAAITEFEKRLSAYCSTTFHLHTLLTFPRELHKSNHHFIFIGSNSSTCSSEEFAKYLNQLQHSGKSTIHVIIGFTDTDFYNALDLVADYDLPTWLSLTRSHLSKETLTLLFYEQLYRGYTILQGKTYHK